MNNLPLTTVDWSKKFNKKKTKYMLIALLFAFFVTFNAYKLLHHAQYESELINVVIATKNIQKYSQLQATDVQFKKIRRDQIPTNALTTPQDIKDLTTLINISKNQILVSQFFKEVTNPNSISAEIKENMMAISVGFDWLIAPVPDIKSGDIIDIIASESHEIKNGDQIIVTAETKFPVRNAKIIRVVKEGDYEQNGHIILEVTEEQANNLMATRALKVILNIVVK